MWPFYPFLQGSREMKQKKKIQPALLLLEDVTNLGKKGELVQAKPGFIRNYLLPKKKAVIADKRTIRMQKELKEERERQAARDREEAEALAIQLKQRLLTILVKNDAQGNLYGSVSATDIVQILQEQEGILIERKNVIILKPIKELGVYEIALKLKENIPATFKLKVEGETKVKEARPQLEVIDEEAQAIDKKELQEQDPLGKSETASEE